MTRAQRHMMDLIHSVGRVEGTGRCAVPGVHGMEEVALHQSLLRAGNLSLFGMGGCLA